jgi:hypothetical protein
VRSFSTLYCGALLLWPLFAFANAPHGIELRLVPGSYQPGDVVEIQAEMRRADYAEFQLHVPTHPQLHFVAHTREPLRYKEGEYLQRSVLLLQPMSAGAFKLDAITASLSQGEQATEVPLPSLEFFVNSYEATDDSKELEPLPMHSFVPPGASGFLGLVVLLLGVLGLVIWLLKRGSTCQADTVVHAVDTLDDLTVLLERGDSPEALIERLLCRSDLSLSVELREALDAAVYANRLDAAHLLRLIREEASR